MVAEVIRQVGAWVLAPWFQEWFGVAWETAWLVAWLALYTVMAGTIMVRRGLTTKARGSVTWRSLPWSNEFRRHMLIGLSIGIIFLLSYSFADELLKVQERVKKLEEGVQKIRPASSEASPVPVAGAPDSRPRFTSERPYLQALKDGQLMVRAQARNNRVPAINVTSRLIILDRSLDPNVGPLFLSIADNANADVGEQQLYFHALGIEAIQQPANLGYALFQLQYTDARSDRTYRQDFYLKFIHVLGTGDMLADLGVAGKDEKARIDKYMAYHDEIPAKWGS